MQDFAVGGVQTPICCAQCRVLRCNVPPLKYAVQQPTRFAAPLLRTLTLQLTRSAPCLAALLLLVCYPPIDFCLGADLQVVRLLLLFSSFAEDTLCSLLAAFQVEEEEPLRRLDPADTATLVSGGLASCRGRTTGWWPLAALGTPSLPASRA